MQPHSNTPGDGPVRDAQTPPTTGPSATGEGGATAVPAQSSTQSPASRSATGTVNRTRTAGAWIGLVVGAIILIVLLVFILQNNESAQFSIFFWKFSLPLGVSMLFAAIAGALVMALVGGARILQLRRAYRQKRP